MSDTEANRLRGYAAAGPVPDHVVESTVNGGASYAIKPLFDFAFALGAVVFFLPFMMVCGFAIFAYDFGPIFIAHERVGQNGRKFRCLKFRTMVTDAQQRLEQMLAECPKARAEWETSHKLKDDPRVTPVGKFLRKTSLDELPQFFNVLFGSMSVVGPRPIVESEVPRYGPHFQAYAAAKPGITGHWQTSGRSDTSYDERVSLDVDYVNNMSLRWDMSIIMRTFNVMLNGRGAY